MINPSPIAFNVLGKNVYWYGILIAIGVLLAIYISLDSAKRYGWKQDDVLDFTIFAIPSGIIFARLYYVVFEWPRYAANPISALYIWEGGIAIYGAVIGGLIAAVIFAKVKKLNLLTLIDIVAPGLVLAQALGRWGNFFNQEAFGAEVTNEALKWFPLAIKIDATNTIHYATFFYESMWCLLIFAFIMIARKRFKHKGDVFLTYAMLYAFERMLVEGLRTDSLWWGKIRVSQILSLLLVLAIVAFFIVRSIREKKNETVLEYAMLPDFAYKKPVDEKAAEAEKEEDLPADVETELVDEEEISELKPEDTAEETQKKQ